MSRVTLALVALLVGLAGAMGGYFYGHRQGVVSESAKRDGQAVKDLTGLIDSHKDLVKQAGVASRSIRSALAERAAQDEQSTKDFRDALASTKDSRTGCVFPAGVMRGLSEARDRAARAAASGVGGGLPGTSSSAAHDGGS